MAAESENETILVVDDEEPVRRTFLDWLEKANLGCEVLSAGDAAAALRLADRRRIDLAILDWHLGAGNDGLQLLEDLTVFNPDVVAIMVTGFAHQATPLMAMRMGVRDYLDKNQDLNSATFLRAVRKQLDRIRPARREKRINQGLATFRAAVEQVLPLVQAAEALNDPVPLPAAIRSLFGFLQSTTGARAGVLLVHSYEPQRQPDQLTLAYDGSGQPLADTLVPFARSLAGSVVSMQQPHVMERLDQAAAGGAFDLQPFERGARNVLAAPLSVTTGLQVVLELFDKQDANGSPAAFTQDDRRLAGAAAEFGSDILRQALSERQTHRILFDAVAAALRAGDEVAQALRKSDDPRPESPPPDVMEQLHAGLRGGSAGAIDASTTLRLAEAIRVLALRYGPRAVEHCIRLVEDLRGVLDEVAGV
jgi:two-component system nitrogen regulation response regulator NtrX